MSTPTQRHAHRRLRATIVTALVISGGTLIASCGDDGVLSGDGPISSLVDRDVTIPDVSVPDVTIPDVSAPDVTLPDITLPGGDGGATTAAPAPTAAPIPAPAGSTDPGVAPDDSGLGPFGLITLVLLAGLIGGLIVWLTRRGDHGPGTPSQRSQTARNVDRLIDDARWAVGQASAAAAATDLGRVAGAWPVMRDHFIDIERAAANIHTDDAPLAAAVDEVGRATAELRGALDAFVNALGRHSDGHLDALEPIRSDVTVGSDNLSTRIQALISARSPLSI